jgi:hypothetical protein
MVTSAQSTLWSRRREVRVEVLELRHAVDDHVAVAEVDPLVGHDLGLGDVQIDELDTRLKRSGMSSPNIRAK